MARPRSGKFYPTVFVNGRTRRVHCLVAESVLGRPLPSRAHVHHVNSDFNDNRHRNLVVCQDAAYHRLLHRRQKALAECGHADWLRCMYCGKLDAPSRLHVTRRGNWEKAVHRSCRNTYMREFKARRAS
ncbi:hypothetical protein LCGC14_1413000 [marine sediment metagenome]|uniref:HNH nuclease domain-containing protein n=1 Tax=marine sediment metagenome TaxID=412755 RepID=A0A0F9M926_9ZZZZ